MGDIWDSNKHVNKWRRLASGPFPPRSGGCLAKLSDGRLLLASGMDQDGMLLRDTWVLDNTDTLTPKSRASVLKQKFKIMTTREFDQVFSGDAGKNSAQIPDFTESFSHYDLKVPHGSTLLKKMHDQISAKVKKAPGIQPGHLYEYAFSNSEKSLLVIDAALMVKQETRGVKDTHLRGVMRYFEANNEDAFTELQSMARSKTLNTVQNAYPAGPDQAVAI